MSSDPTEGPILALIVTLGLHFWLNFAESALRALNESGIRQDAEEGRPEAAQLLPLLEERERWLQALRQGRILNSLCCGAVAVYAFIRPMAHGLQMPAPWNTLLALVIGLAALALVLSLLCAALPRALAERSPERTALRNLGAIRLQSALLRPVNRALDALLRLFGLQREDADDVTEEDIRLLVDCGEEAGAIEETEKELIENIFEFNNRTAEDVMTHRTDVVALWIGDDRDTVVKTILETGYSRFPVYDRDMDDIIGILNIRDFLLNSHAERPLPMRALLREPFFVPGTVQADALFRDMQKRKVHMAVVVDEYGGVSGVVTMEDLLEEIVGNIYDEFDRHAEAQIVQLDENLWRIPGAAPLEEVMEALGVRLDTEEDYDTLGGLVFDQLTTIPEDGSHPEVDVEGLHIRVERMAEHRVESALVSLIPPEDVREEE